MASRLLSTRRCVVAYWPNLRSVVRHFVSVTADDAAILAPAAARSRDFLGTVNSDASKSNSSSVKSDLPSGSKFSVQFPLPGHVGLAPTQPVLAFTKSEAVDGHMKQTSSETSAKLEPSSVDMLECVAVEIPGVMRKEFQDLFPDRDLSRADQLTAITLSHRTQRDMTSWNEEVEEEREDLLQTFVAGATDICRALQQAGYWADFVDPSSGRPYFGAYTNATLFETDERYRHLGFEINDLGCCKVICHHLWGTHAYVGCLFTDAPIDHRAISQLVHTA